MLSLTLNSGEYITIGDNVVVQAFSESANHIRVCIQAPREVAILRGELRERTNERPDCLHKKHPKSSSEKARNSKQLEKMAERKSFYETQKQQLLAIAGQLDHLGNTLGGAEELKELAQKLTKTVSAEPPQGS